ncbi:hypothetical protein PJI17_20920 [Mycobacterium kansasii]
MSRYASWSSSGSSRGDPDTPTPGAHLGDLAPRLGDREDPVNNH